MDDEPMLVIGHRGACVHAPENTIPSCEHARDLGAMWIEADVKKTRDGALVLMHDQSVDRTTDGTGLVSERSLHEIQALDAGTWFGAEFAETRVPTLEDLASWASTNDMGICLDLGNGGGLTSTDLTAIGQMLRQYDCAETALAIGSEMATLCELRDQCEEISIGLLYRDNHEDALRRARIARIDFLHPFRRLVSADLIRSAHAAGLPVASAVDPLVELIHERRQWGLDAINCDDPGLCTPPPADEVLS
ncbi:MAG: hypothetical protein HN712_06055 [Gemmatimonadetes bacterium]|nr:hypothetical protein [Gemmatimonadota bacterium]MBT7859855.1 hypothetical protein [Gemmatimonadota bacterium]